MIIMTDGLKELAGDSIRAALMRFTRSPVSGVMTGALSTAMLQSSSATTVAAVGFVGVAIITFQEALGIILGANIGTTITGWFVVMLGFKLKLGSIVLPLVFAGAVLRLFGSGRLAASGYAIAGFGLIFVGITMMQQGMSGLENIISPEDLPADSLGGRLLLVAIGIVTTLITQSSSAGVAASVAALYAGAINLDQGIALIIGMDIGTTVTAVLATIGGTVNAKRTGYSHVAYNLFAGVGALLVMTPYILLLKNLFPDASIDHSGVALISFHTIYNTLGVIIILPFFNRIAYFMERLVPEKPLVYTQKLDKSLYAQPDLALNVVQTSISSELLALLAHSRFILGDTSAAYRVNLNELHQALDKTQVYTDRIQLSTREGTDWERLISIIHTLDHLRRLLERCEEEEDRANTVRVTPFLGEARAQLNSMIVDISTDIKDQHWVKASQRAKKTETWMDKHVAQLRENIMIKIANSDINAPEGTRYLEAVRWLQRVSRHIARITHHYSRALIASGTNHS